MSAVTDLRRADPRTLDDVVRRSGWAARRGSKTGAAWGRAFGLSDTRGKRARLGDVGSAATSVLSTIHALDTNEGTSSLPLLMEGWALRKRLRIEKLDNDELRALIADCTRREHFAEARENQHMQELRDDSAPEDDEAAAEADMDEAELQVERAEALRERAKRKRLGRWSELDERARKS